MKTTNSVICLFAALLTSATLTAEVVYEPLVVDSGFNRDVIAESVTDQGTISSAVASSPIVLNSLGSVDSCFGTDSVIAKVNADDFDQTSEFWKAEYDLSVSCGWPTDFGNPEDRIIRCVEDARTNYSDPDVFFHLAPYDGLNALCLRPNSGGYTYQRTGTLKFKKIGCYDKVFFLFVSLKKGGDGEGRRVITTIHYTDGSTTSTEFTFAGLGGEAGRRVHKTNIYESGIFKKLTAKENPKNLAYASVFDIEVDDSKLIEKIVFENPKENSAAIVLGVAGRTADMPVPEEKTATVSEISENSFRACWEAVADAESYRLDVAEDIDFQHILANYNNKEIDEGTCAEIVELVTNSDYYWRVRSVNGDGGQSASSAPHRVKTAGGTPPETAEDHMTIEEELAPHINASYSTFNIYRKLWRDGYYNTLCLPFNMTQEEIAASPLTGATVFEYVRAEKMGEDQLDIEVSETDHITAGVPYLIQWPNLGDVIGNPLVFHNVTIRTNVGQTIGGEDEVRYVGNIATATMVDHDVNNLFLGANNILYWPEGETKIKGFRAFFQIPSTGAQAVARNTPARIIQQKNVTTGMETVTGDGLSVAAAQKRLINGQVVIIRDGQSYNLLGGKLAPMP